MPGFFKAAKKLFFGSDNPNFVQEIPPACADNRVNRKRKLNDEQPAALKRQRLVMDNIDSEEDVQIIPGKSFIERVISPVLDALRIRSKFHPSLFVYTSMIYL